MTPALIVISRSVVVENVDVAIGIMLVCRCIRKIYDFSMEGALGFPGLSMYMENS